MPNDDRLHLAERRVNSLMPGNERRRRAPAWWSEHPWLELADPHKTAHELCALAFEMRKVSEFHALAKILCEMFEPHPCADIESAHEDKEIRLDGS